MKFKNVCLVIILTITMYGFLMSSNSNSSNISVNTSLTEATTYSKCVMYKIWNGTEYSLLPVCDKPVTSKTTYKESK